MAEYIICLSAHDCECDFFFILQEYANCAMKCRTPSRSMTTKLTSNAPIWKLTQVPQIIVVPRAVINGSETITM